VITCACTRVLRDKCAHECSAVEALVAAGPLGALWRETDDFGVTPLNSGTAIAR
jgi:hypothetical protein